MYRDVCFRYFASSVILLATLCAAVESATIRGLEQQGDIFSFEPGDSVTRISADGKVAVTRGNCPPNADCAYATWPLLTPWQNVDRVVFSGAGFLTDLSSDGSRFVGISFEGTDEDGYLSDAYFGSGDVLLARFTERFVIDEQSPLSISGDGKIVVATVDNQPFLWTEEAGTTRIEKPAGWSTVLTADMSLDGSTLVGTLANEEMQKAFRWSTDGYQELQDFEAGQSSARHVSRDGQIVVGTYVNGDQTSFFRWTNESKMVILGPGASVAMSGDASVIVGNSRHAPDEPTQDLWPFAWREPFMWTEQDGIRELRSVLVNDYGMEAMLNGWALDSVVDISEDGMTLVGRGHGPGGQTSWLITLADTAPCDVNANGICDSEDIQHITRAMQFQDYVTAKDVDLNQVINQEDRRIWVEELMGTSFGDANLDGVFNSTDLIQVMGAGQYEDDRRFNSTWETGDWDGDGEFTSNDFVLAMLSGGYQQNSQIIASVVPEPAGNCWLFAILVLILARPQKGKVRRGSKH